MIVLLLFSKIITTRLSPEKLFLFRPKVIYHLHCIGLIQYFTGLDLLGATTITMCGRATHPLQYCMFCRLAAKLVDLSKIGAPSTKTDSCCTILYHTVYHIYSTVYCTVEHAVQYCTVYHIYCTVEQRM